MHNVIFDLGGVVLKWSPDDILEEFYADEAARAQTKREVFQHNDWLDLDRGTLLEPDAIVRFHQRTGRPREEMSALMQAVKDSLQPVPGTVDLLEELAARGIPLYCLSNMPATTADYLRQRHSFWKVFGGVVISGEIQLLKPEREIFDHIAQRFALTPENTVFIDDHGPNIDSAKRLGFKTIHFQTPGQCRTELFALLAQHDTTLAEGN
jgi:putative hydrolase of the HAD superfamily